MRKIIVSFVCISLVLLSSAEACRLYVAVGNNIASNTLVEHLDTAPNSLKHLGEKYQDGWSLAYYSNEHATIHRSEHASHVDDKFSLAVEDVVDQESPIVLGHLRRASSGCVDGVPNPHPFTRERDGKTWLFGHNGGIKKNLLRQLIGEEYLTNNPPQVCTENAPDSWVDSELYFIYLLKMVEESDGDVKLGLTQAIQQLHENIEQENRYLNFFLSDGAIVWVYREGTSLFYQTHEGVTYIASTQPEENAGMWREFPIRHLGILQLNQSPVFIDLN